MKPMRFLVAALLIGLLGIFHAQLRFPAICGVLFWMTSLGLGAFYCRRLDGDLVWPGRWTRCDTYVLLGLAFAFAPLYLGWLHNIPSDINSDEVVIVQTQIMHAKDSWNRLLTLSPYFSHPAMNFIVTGHIGQWLGGLSIETGRLISAAIGLACVLLTYVFWRLSFPIGLSICGAVLLGAQHVFLGVSRMAIWCNQPVLFLLLSSIFFVIGLRTRQRLWVYAGALAAGLGFYTYMPGRLIFPVWTAVFVQLPWMIPNRWTWKQALGLWGIAAVGFGLIVAPVIAATLRTPNASYWTRNTFLFFPEARQLQKEWVGAHSIAEGLRRNTKDGLLAFNNQVLDMGFIYPNGGSKKGFSDPLTGVLLWLGVVLALRQWGRRRGGKEATLWAITGFLAAWITVGALTTKAPNYTRLIMALPFAGVLVLMAIRAVWVCLAALFQKQHWSFPLKGLGIVLVVMTIAVLNGRTFETVMRLIEVRGQDFSGTSRYIEARKQRLPYTFLVVEDSRYHYFWWYLPGATFNRLSFFANPSQSVRVVEAATIFTTLPPPPFTVFMNELFWQESRRIWFSLYPSGKDYSLTPAGACMAFEVS